jgi:hypothetical protein
MKKKKKEKESYSLVSARFILSTVDCCCRLLTQKKTPGCERVSWTRKRKKKEKNWY